MKEMRARLDQRNAELEAKSQNTLVVPQATGSSESSGDDLGGLLNSGGNNPHAAKKSLTCLREPNFLI